MSLFISSSRRRHSPLLRHLTTSSAAKNKIKKTFDPDAAVSVLSAASDPSSSPSRFALDLTVRRLARARRYSDIHSLLQSRLLSHPLPHPEPLLSSLILTYSTARMLSHSRHLFDQIPHPTSLSFNALLSAHVKSHKPRLVPDLFLSLPLRHPSISPDAVSFGILIKSLCLSGDLEKAAESFNSMKEKGFAPNLVTVTTLLDCYYKNRKTHEAERLWDEMVGCGLKPDLTAYNVKAMHFSMHGNVEGVMGVMREIEAAGLRPDAITYNYLITCYCGMGRVEEAKEAYRRVWKKNVAANAAIFKMFVGFLCKVEEYEMGLEVFRDSVKWNKVPDFQTLKGLVEGLVGEGKVEGAKEVVREVRRMFPKESMRKWGSLETKLGLREVEEEVEAVAPGSLEQEQGN